MTHILAIRKKQFGRWGLREGALHWGNFSKISIENLKRLGLKWWCSLENMSLFRVCQQLRRTGAHISDLQLSVVCLKNLHNFHKKLQGLNNFGQLHGATRE